MSELQAEEDQQRQLLRPLTRRNKAGLIYERDAHVEQQIKKALVLEPPVLVARARLQDHQASDYLQEEALVYLLREYHRNGDAYVVNHLAEALLRRCMKSINDTLKALGPDVVEDAVREVIGTLASRIFDLESTKGDYFQVRFWRALNVVAINAFNRHVRQLKQAQNVIHLSTLRSINQDEDGESVGSTAPSGDLRDPSISPEQRVGVLRVGSDLQGSDDDDGGDRPGGASLGDTGHDEPGELPGEGGNCTPTGRSC